MFISGGPRILDANRSNSSINIAFGAVAAVEVFLILILSVLARHANLIWAKNRFFVRLIMQIALSNSARIANVCRVRKHVRKPELVEIIFSLLGQSLPANHKQANGVGVDTPCGEVSAREIIVIVPALLEL